MWGRGGAREQAILESFRRLNLWQRGSERAPHKPLLVLLALGELMRGGPRLLSYRTIDPKLRHLLSEFGPPRKSYHSEYPFWRLQNDGIWEIEDAERFAVRDSNTDAKKSELLRYDAQGGFSEEINGILTDNLELARTLAHELLAAHFPPSIHDDILSEVGLDLEGATTARPRRDPSFRRDVLDAYGCQCTVCHASIRLQDRTIGLEAAHIRWHQAGGPDTRDNGLALCSLHHKMFDLGTFTLTPKHRILVSELVSGNRAFRTWVGRFHEPPARQPVNADYFPHWDYLDWHRRQVFREPPRAS
jgi:putative restriction endonuclease